MEPAAAPWRLPRQLPIQNESIKKGRKKRIEKTEVQRHKQHDSNHQQCVVYYLPPAQPINFFHFQADFLEKSRRFTEYVHNLCCIRQFLKQPRGPNPIVPNII